MRKTDLLFHLVSKIPPGKVATYGKLTKIAGLKNARTVGQIIHKNPDPVNIPCHRVVRSDGKIAEGFAFGGKKAQIKKLRKEGVVVRNGKIDLKKFGWLL